MAKKKRQLNFSVIGLDDFYRLYGTAAGKKFFDHFFKDQYHYTPEEGREKMHKSLEARQKILMGFIEERGQKRPVGLISFMETPQTLRTVKTFVAKKYRRQGIASKMTDHLIGLARSKKKFIYRGLQSESMLALARKKQARPRTMYRKGRAVGPAEIIHVSSEALGNVIIFPESGSPKTKKTPLQKIAEKLKKKPKRPR